MAETSTWRRLLRFIFDPMGSIDVRALCPALLFRWSLVECTDDMLLFPCVRGSIDVNSLMSAVERSRTGHENTMNLSRSDYSFNQVVNFSVDQASYQPIQFKVFLQMTMKILSPVSPVLVAVLIL